MPRTPSSDRVPGDLLRDRTVFISGGGSGVNLAIARTCAAAGANLVLCGRTETKLSTAVKELQAGGAQATYAVADVRDPDAVAAAFAHGAERFGPVDAVVCGAAGNFLAPAERITSNGFRAVMDIVSGLTGPTIGQVKNDASLQTKVASESGLVTLQVGGQGNPDSPLSKADVRKAVSMGIDRAAIVKTLLGGEG